MCIFSSSLFPFSLLVFSTYDFLILALILFLIILANIFNYYIQEVSGVFPCDSADKRICLQCGRPGFDPWVGKIPWRREWLLTPVFWPREFHGLYSLWGCRELDTIELLSLLHQVSGFPNFCPIWMFPISFQVQWPKKTYQSLQTSCFSRSSNLMFWVMFLTPSAKHLC